MSPPTWQYANGVGATLGVFPDGRGGVVVLAWGPGEQPPHLWRLDPGRACELRDAIDELVTPAPGTLRDEAAAMLRRLPPR